MYCGFLFSAVRMGRIPKVEKEKALEVFHQEGSDYNKLELKVEQTGTGTYDFQLNPKEYQNLMGNQRPHDQFNGQSSPQNMGMPIFAGNSHQDGPSNMVTTEMSIQGFKYPEPCFTDSLAGPSGSNRMHDSSCGMQYGGQNERSNYPPTPRMQTETAMPSGALFVDDMLKCDPPQQMPFKQENLTDDYPVWSHQPHVSQECSVPSPFHDSLKNSTFSHSDRSNTAAPMFPNSNAHVFDYHVPQTETLNHKSGHDMYDFMSPPKTKGQVTFDSSKPIFAQDSLAFDSPISDLPIFETNNFQMGRSSYPPSFQAETKKDSSMKHVSQHSEKDSSLEPVFSVQTSSSSQSHEHYKNGMSTSVDLSHVSAHTSELYGDTSDKFSGGWRDRGSFNSDRSLEQSYNRLPQYTRLDSVPAPKLGLSLPNMKTYTGQTCTSVPSSPDIRSCATPSSVTSHEGSSASQTGRYNPILIKMLIEQVLESNQGVDIMDKVRNKLNDPDVNQEAAQKLLNLVNKVSTRRGSSGDDSSIESGSCGLSNSALALIPEDKTQALARFLKDVSSSPISPKSGSVLSSASSGHQQKHKRTISEAGLYQCFENLDMKKSAISISESASSKRSSITTLGSPPGMGTIQAVGTEVTRADSSNDIVTSTEIEEEDHISAHKMKTMLDGLNLGMKILFRYKPEHREKRRLYNSGKVSSIP